MRQGARPILLVKWVENVLVSFQVESEFTLARDVGPGADALPLSGVPGAGSRINPYLIPGSPWEFLLAAGRATAAIFSPFKQLFEISSHWAIARWFWALDWSSTNVALSPHAKEIRNHHRTAFSEASGLAAGLLVVEHLAGHALPPGAWRGGPMLVDVDSLISSGPRPDLLIFFGHPGLTTYVLEAKGNSTGRDVSIEQLRRGIHQVRAISGPAERLVVGAAVRGPHVSVHAISVPKPKSRKTSGWLMRKAEESVLAMEMQRLASFAGVPDLEASERAWERFEIPQLGREIVGRRLTVPGQDFRAEITMGVDRFLVERLRRVRSSEELTEVRVAVNGDGFRQPPGEEAIASLTDTGRAATAALDGCALSILLL